ncbi:MAG: CDP-alcohol phosphatidyltransferase family protein [archaeon]
MKNAIGLKDIFLRKHLSAPTINFLKKTPIKAEQITAIRITLEVISALMLSIGAYYYSLTAMIIFQFASFMDSVDGAIARHRKCYSKNWVIVDGVFHHIVSPLLLLCLGIGMFRSTNRAIFLYAGFVGAFAQTLSQVIQADLSYFRKHRDTKVERAKKGGIINNTYLLFWDFIRLEQPLSILFFAVVFNVPAFALLFYCLFNLLRLTMKIIEVIKLPK